MVTAKMTAKRQVTFPVEVCRELGVGPGDRLVFEHRYLDGATVWVIQSKKIDLSWMGALKKYARGKSFDKDDIQRSIARGRRSE